MYASPFCLALYNINFRALCCTVDTVRRTVDRGLLCIGRRATKLHMSLHLAMPNPRQLHSYLAMALVLRSARP